MWIIAIVCLVIIILSGQWWGFILIPIALVISYLIHKANGTLKGYKAELKELMDKEWNGEITADEYIKEVNKLQEKYPNWYKE